MKINLAHMLVIPYRYCFLKNNIEEHRITPTSPLSSGLDHDTQELGVLISFFLCFISFTIRNSNQWRRTVTYHSWDEHLFQSYCLLTPESWPLTCYMPLFGTMAPSCWTRTTRDTFNVWISCASITKSGPKKVKKKAQKKKTWPCIHGCDKKNADSLEKFHFCNLWRHWFAPDQESWLWFYNNAKKLTSMRSVVAHEHILSHPLSAIVFQMHTILHLSHVGYPHKFQPVISSYPLFLI